MGFMSRFPGGSSVKVPEVEELWTAERHTGAVWGVATDEAGNVYSGGADNTVRKFDTAGREVWCFSVHANTVYAVTADPTGTEIRSSGSDGRLCAIANGEEVWSVLATGSTHSLCLGKDMSVTGNFGPWIRRFDKAGELVWEYIRLPIEASSIYGLAMDEGGNVYVPFRCTDGSLWGIMKLSDTGEELWRGPGAASGSPRIVAVKEGNRIYFANSPKAIQALDWAGKAIWLSMTDVPGTVYGGLVENDGSFTLFKASKISRVDADGNERLILDHAGTTSTPSSVSRCAVRSNDGSAVRGCIDGSIRKIVFPFGVLVLRKGEAAKKMTVTRLEDSGDPPWERRRYAGGGTQRAVAVDASGRIWSGGADQMVTVRDGTGICWQYEAKASVNDIALYSGGGAYLGLYVGPVGGPVRRLTADGTELWRFTGGKTAYVRTVSLCFSGGVFAPGGSPTHKNVLRLSPDGEEIWCYFRGFGGITLNGCSDATGVYLPCGGTPGGVVKLSDGGEEIWVSVLGMAQCVAEDPLGGVYASSTAQYTSFTVDGVVRCAWPKATGAVYAMLVEPSGKFYVGGQNGVAALDNGGNVLWEWEKEAAQSTRGMDKVDGGSLWACSGSDIVELREIYKIY